MIDINLPLWLSDRAWADSRTYPKGTLWTFRLHDDGRYQFKNDHNMLDFGVLWKNDGNLCSHKYYDEMLIGVLKNPSVMQTKLFKVIINE